ncbi:hypothetical protein HDU98_006962 [Podochytrium sp. JEL0797]|nr:hypothetical protein HDU98_006962 [Podochytrium sp. JEL0797]
MSPTELRPPIDTLLPPTLPTSTTSTPLPFATTTTFTIASHSVTLCEENPDKTVDLDGFIAKKAWPAASVLAEYFSWRFRNCASGDGVSGANVPRRMLELGAGTGFTSLFLGKAVETHCGQCDVHVSDLAIAVPLIRKNIELNFAEGGTSVRLHATELDWMQADKTREWVEALETPVDLVFAADVVYFPYLFDALIRTLYVLATEGRKGKGAPEVVVVCRLRELSKEVGFYARLGKYFRLEALAEEEWDNGKFWKCYKGEFVMFRCVVREVVLEADESEDFELMIWGAMDDDLFS